LYKLYRIELEDMESMCSHKAGYEYGENSTEALTVFLHKLDLRVDVKEVHPVSKPELLDASVDLELGSDLFRLREYLE